MIKTSSGILYPENASDLIDIKEKNSVSLPAVRTVPHKAWSLCKDELDRVFSSLNGAKADYIFVFSPLHQGRIGDEFKIYTHNEYNLSFPVERNDDICAEEFSYEILLPYIEKLFPSARSYAFYAPDEENPETGRLID
ncbi:MAG: hypothetical protein K5634_04130, partial [Sphaerochaetaceae bacterium]|nr:hypothetical protein [Sphaerochaetaceae bacterium]